MRILLSFVGIALSLGAYAGPDVGPGQTVEFITADGGMVECRILDISKSCSTGYRWRNASFGITSVIPGANRIIAVVDPIVPIGFTNPSYAISSIYNDFQLTPRPGGMLDLVDVQISITWDYFALLVGDAAYDTSVSLFLKVADVTNGGPGVLITTQTLYSQDRSGDQGFTDVSIGSESALLYDENSHVGVKLRTGRTYRITFEVRSAISVLLVGEPGAMANANWTNLSVSVDEDEYDRLLEHDDAISQQILAHDVTISTQVSQHDADIKVLLAELKEGQEEIMRLLLTPQGRRESDQGDWPLKPIAGAVPEVTQPQNNGKGPK